MVGREAEVAVVETFLGQAEVGTLAIVGEPGIGKTTVWAHAVRRAQENGAVLLRANPAEAEAKLSFAGLADLLAPVSADHIEALPGPQRAALDAALLRAKSKRPPERRVVGTALLSLLRALAAERPVVLAIDDLQWLDRPSLAAVEFAVRRLADDPVQAIVSVRSTHADMLSPVQRLELGPLSVGALHRILADDLGHTFSRPTLVRIAQMSGGNALYALEIGRLLDRADVGLEALPVPESLQTLVTERVRTLPESARAALLRAAALARPSLSLVGVAELAPAEEAGLVRIDSGGRIEFVHPLFASAVYSSAPLSNRRATHLALAAAVDDPEERARHLALAAEGRDEQVARTVQEAAVRARSRGAPDAAAELTELALRLLPEDSPDTDELRYELARHFYYAGDFQHASAVLTELLRDIGGGDLRARALLNLAEIEYWRSGESAAVELAEEALASSDDRLLRGRCQAAIAMWAGTVDLAKAATAARAAVELLEDLPDAEPGLVAEALGARVRADLFLGEGLDAEAAERARKLEETAPPAAVDARVVFKLGQWLRYVDDLDGARAMLAAAERQANDEGDEASLPNILLNRVVVETWAGRWSEASELTERMTEAFEQLGIDQRGNPWRAYVDAHAGRLDNVRAAAGERPAEPIIAMIWSRCVGLAELAGGDAEAADRHLAAALGELDRVEFREPAVWRVDGDAIEAAVLVGDTDRAEALLERFERRAARSRIPWSLAVSARCRALLLAARGELDAAAEALEQALDAHERSPIPFEHARTLLVRGQVLRRLKQKRESREALEGALEIFRQLGAEAWVAYADSELQRVAVRRALSDLTATELKIARLAADGLTNRAIAAEAFVSQKAVEANLARAYRKLGIRSRAQLARALDAREEVSAP